MPARWGSDKLDVSGWTKAKIQGLEAAAYVPVPQKSLYNVGLVGGMKGRWRQVWRAGWWVVVDVGRTGMGGVSPVEPGTGSGLGKITSQIRRISAGIRALTTRINQRPHSLQAPAKSAQQCNLGLDFCLTDGMPRKKRQSSQASCWGISQAPQQTTLAERRAGNIDPKAHHSWPAHRLRSGGFMCPKQKRRCRGVRWAPPVQALCWCPCPSPLTKPA